MPNKNYTKGRSFEYRCMEHFRKLGYYTIRSYGSKGIFDFIAVPSKINTVLDWGHETLLVQCKTNGYCKPIERQTLIEASKRYKAIVLLTWIGEKHEICFKEIKEGCFDPLSNINN